MGLKASRAISLENAESSEVLTGFRSLAECSPAGLFIVDREGCCTYMNPRAIAICKSTVLSSTQQPWAQSLGLEDPASIMASWSATAGIEYSETFRICTPDSTWRWIEVRTLPIVSGGGMVAGHSGVVQDISERWLAQRQTTARDTITHILAHADSPESACSAILCEIGEILGWDAGVFWGVDRQTKFLGAIAVWPGRHPGPLAFETDSRRTSLAPGIGLPGRVWVTKEPAWISDVTLDANFPRVRAATEGGLHGALAFPIMAGGEVFGVLEFFSHAVLAPQPDFLRLAGVIGSQIGQFISRKQHENDLRQSEEKFSRVVQNIGEVLWIADPTARRPVYISPAYDVIWGRSRQALLRDPGSFLETIHPNDRPLVVAFCDRAFQGVRTEEEYRVIRPDGTIVWIRDLAFPVKDQDGRLEHVARLAVDITERIERQQQRTQKAKAEAIGALAGGLAHDLNNLLTAILGGASLAAEMLAENHPARSLLCNVSTSGERAALIVAQMLAYARKGRFFNEFIDLSGLARDFLREVAASVPAKIQLRSELALSLPPLEGDRNQIRQLIGNLYLNALEAIGDASGIVTICTGSEIIGVEAAGASPAVVSPCPPGEYVFLRVTDTGCGIEDAIRPRIFDPFFTTKFIGRGLGLSAAAGIVGAHGGAIRVSSDIGAGSIFTCILPVAVNAPAAGLDESGGVRTSSPNDGRLRLHGEADPESCPPAAF
jgi:PAS domain S-box-containing protein